MVICWEYQSVSEPNQQPSGMRKKIMKQPAVIRRKRAAIFFLVKGLELLEIFIYVRCLSGGNRRNDAPSKKMADCADDSL